MASRIGIAKGQDLYNDDYDFDEMNPEIEKIFMEEDNKFFDDEEVVTPKMRAFLELGNMVIPISQVVDYNKELAVARDEQCGYVNEHK
ncbi:MAG: hypothetical protein HDR05_05340 [Lachnospiraceae bacterium]|nr:hypothetical protein [Lachnospiraceae bacterium]